MFRKKYIPRLISPIELDMVNLITIYNPRVHHITKYHRLYEIVYLSFLRYFIYSYFETEDQAAARYGNY